MAPVDVSDLEDLLDELRSVRETVGRLATRVCRIETALGGAGAVLGELDTGAATASGGVALCSES